MTSALWSATAASVASASKRGSCTTWLPQSSAPIVQTMGPLWYRGAGITRQPSGTISSEGPASRSISAGSPATISLGRPVEPPDVGAFHAGLTTSGSSSSGGTSAAGWATHRDRLAAGQLAVLEHDDHRWVGQVDDARQLSLGESPAHRLGRGADLPAADRGDEPLDRAGQHDRHEVAGPPRPPSRSTVGHPVAPPLELGPGHGEVGARDGGSVRRGLGQLGQAPWVRDGSHRCGTLPEAPPPHCGRRRAVATTTRDLFRRVTVDGEGQAGHPGSRAGTGS